VDGTTESSSKPVTRIGVEEREAEDELEDELAMNGWRATEVANKEEESEVGGDWESALGEDSGKLKFLANVPVRCRLEGGAGVGHGDWEVIKAFCALGSGDSQTPERFAARGLAWLNVG